MNHLHQTESRRILKLGMPFLAKQGFQDSTFNEILTASNIDHMKGEMLFPKGVLSLAILFVEEGICATSLALETLDKESMRVRDRVKEAVKMRLMQDEASKPVAKKAFSFLSQPQNMVESMRLVAKTADIIWQFAGDESLDFNYYTKRGILSGIYVATRLVWLNDESKDYEASWAFLDNRIDDVMQFEKLKAKWREEVKTFRKNAPDIASFLAQARHQRKF